MASLESCPATFKVSSQQGEKCPHRAHPGERQHESRLFRFQKGPRMKRRSWTVNPDGRWEEVEMASMKAKKIVYRYNEDAESDEEEFDLSGEFVVPEHDSLITRHGKLWRAVHVEWVIKSSDHIPLVRVFLSDLLID